MNKKRYTAAEIAGMCLAGLPATKAAIITRATSEGWPYQEKKGIGGTRRLYEVPAKYFPAGDADTLASNGASHQMEPTAPGKVVGAIAANGKIDAEILKLVVQTLEDWAKERRVEIPSDRKAILITVLYDYALKGADTEEIARLLQAVG